MLIELAVRNLGVIEEASVVLRPGLTAITGETGAGKTLVTGAIGLLVGDRADSSLVRSGADEAEVEGRFLVGGPEGHELVVRRVIPTVGRSRAYIDGRLATLASLTDHVGGLVDIHSQHGHRSLLEPRARRAALDGFAGVDLTCLEELIDERRTLERQLAGLGGDERERAREVELLRYQLNELSAAGLDDPDEDEQLRAEEERLAGAEAHRDAAFAALRLLGADGQVGDGLAATLGAVHDRPPLGEITDRIESIAAEVAAIADDVRHLLDTLHSDPQRLVEVGDRRRALAELRRKYGESLSEVLAYRAVIGERLDELEGREGRAADLDAMLEANAGSYLREAARVGALRRDKAPVLARRVEDHLAALALPAARFSIEVGPDPGDEVQFLASMNSGIEPQPIAKAASGGELSRLMLALQLVVAAEPPTVLFDEIDAGVGGEAATSVGRALARLAGHHQVLVVTHLPQVAAFAGSQILIEKHDDGLVTRATVTELGDEQRVVELSRMLSGSPSSEVAQQHVRELLGAARAADGGPG